ncbi:MAG TPA: hypothetical protein VEX15_15290 [Nocardioidaceae bacterium]|nr:hypothetical protein [Nocardioidaceae bacterium]
MSSLNAAGPGPFVVARRAGNDLRSLRRPETAQAAVVDASRSTTLIQDLKGRDIWPPSRVAEALGQRPRDVTVCCSQNWALLTAMRDIADVRLMHSVGSARQLAALRKYAAKQPMSGISIHLGTGPTEEAG